MEKILEQFVDGLKEAYGTNIRSLVLYGSKASGEDTRAHSDYNILMILETVTFAHLKMDGIMKKWVKQGNPPPLIFSRELFQSSTDIFPIEFLDMKDNHKILLGEDPFTDLKIDLKHLRHECEFELTGKLLKLRQAFMPVVGKQKRVRELLLASLSPVQVVLRHVLRLYNETPPAMKGEAPRTLSKYIDFEPAVFETVQRMKQGERDALRLDPETVMEEYLLQLEKVVAVVDQIV
jgi:hypothetical protein